MISEFRHGKPTAMLDCPYCGTTPTVVSEVFQTTMGYLGGLDPNRHTETRSCSACKNQWLRSWVPEDQSLYLALRTRCKCGGAFVKLSDDASFTCELCNALLK
jgi:hypothetical protein